MGMDGNGLEWKGMGGENGWQWVEMGGNGWSEWVGMGGNGMVHAIHGINMGQQGG